MSFVQELQEAANFTSRAVTNSFEYSSSGVASLSGAYVTSGSVGMANGSVNQIAQDLLQLPRQGGSVYATTGSAAAASYGAAISGLSSYSTGAVFSGGTLSVAGGNAAAAYVSQVENSILASTVPITVNETEEITVLGKQASKYQIKKIINYLFSFNLPKKTLN